MKISTVILRTLKFCLLVLPVSAWGTTALQPTRKLVVDGAKIAIYESAGKAGPGILLIHGNTSSSNSYAKFMESSFARTNRVVAMDLPGYGKSDNNHFYNVAVFRKAIVGVAKQTGLDKGIIVGWSWGGDLALQAVTQLPQVKGVFIFGTAPIGGAPAGSPSPLLRPNETYAGLATTYGILPKLTNSMVRSYVNAFFAPNFGPIPNFLYEDGYRTASGTRTAVALVGLGLDITHKPEVTIMKNLKIPVAMVYTTRDAFIRFEYLKSIEDSIPTLWTGKTVLVQGYGHALQWESPQVFSELLQDFISDL